jgi:hypothetical protein
VISRICKPYWIDKRTGEKRYSPPWWIAYSVRGKLHRESARTKKESDAWKVLKKRHSEIALGRPVGPDIEKTTFEDEVRDFLVKESFQGLSLSSAQIKTSRGVRSPGKAGQ